MKLPRGSWVAYKGRVGIVLQNYDEVSDIAIVDNYGETTETLEGIKHSSISPAAEDDIPESRK